MSRCVNCDKPEATDADFQAIAPGEGEHLCWAAYGTPCESEDWRSRALEAEARKRELLDEVSRLRRILMCPRHPGGMHFCSRCAEHVWKGLP